jgi:hypothetical protein
MRMKIKTIILFSCVLYLSGCTTFRRYSSVTNPGTDSTLAGIDLFGTRISPVITENGAKSLWDLSADAQTQFIRILNSRYPDNDGFLKSLSFEYLKGNKKDNLSPDYITRDLRLVFSVSRRSAIRDQESVESPVLSPADRLEYIKISLTLNDPALRFKGWNLYSTEYGSLEIGDVGFSKTLDLSSSAALGLKNAELSAGTVASLGRKENQAIRERYLKLSGRISDQKIEMEEEGNREIDLTGNIIADVSLEFERYSEMLTLVYGLKDSTGAFNPPEKLSADLFLVSVPGKKNIDEKINGVLKMEFVYRNVKKGRRTFQEWDDRVKYYRGTVTKPVTLFTARDYVPGFYCLGALSGDSKREIVDIERESGDRYPLIFSDYNEASAFYDWIIHTLYAHKETKLKIGDISLKFIDDDLGWELLNKEVKFGVLPYYW